MVDPVVIPLINVGVALTSMLLNAAQQSEAAAIASEARDPIAFLAQSLLGRGGTQKDIERRISKDLTSRMQDMNERCSREGIDPDRLANPCAEVEDILRAIDDHKRFLEQAVHDPDAVRAFFKHQAQNSRIQVDERLVPYFDELIKAVTELYITYAEQSSNYQQLALKQLLKSDRESREALARMHETIADVPHKVAELVSSDSKPSRVFFGSRPDVATGDRYVERDEQKHLNELIIDPTKQRTVLVGMRGCGKTQLASTLAQQCEDAHWSLVAWVNAGSPESIKSDLVELAKELKKELKIDTSDQPTPETIIRRLFNRLKSADPSDRLIVFDNVENIADLRRLVPNADGLRVVATTTNNTGWGHQGWDTIKVGVFDRDESIKYILTATESTDRGAADTLAHRLGDLPLAIAQAAAFAQKRKLDLAQYLERLDAYRSKCVMPADPADYYARDVATALRVAIDDTLKELEASMSRAARRHLGALALLAESGVPTRWLDPLTEEHHYQDPRDRDRAADDDAHDALTELIDRSIIQQSVDGSTTMLHRLQAQVLRESWSEEEREQACESAATLLESVDIEGFPRDAIASLRNETRDLIEQLRALGTQKESHPLFDTEQIRSCLMRAFVDANELGLTDEALTLQHGVEIIQSLMGSAHSDVLTLQNNLA
ncbi:NB-ARC domain-containing protein, partial [Pauljensenia sp. 20925_1_27]